MALWLVRAGSKGEQEEIALEKGLVTIGWSELPDLSKVPSRDELKKVYEKAYPGERQKKVVNVVGQIWRFAHDIRVGDLVVLPLKRTSSIAIGRVDGPYKLTESNGKIARHVLPVRWIRTDFPRTDFDQDLLYSFGAFMMVCQIQRNDAEARVRAILDGKRSEASPGEGPGEDEIDIEQIARDQLLGHISQNFKGHGLTALVDAVLRAQGYMTLMSPPGADGGIDILAGRGPMGLDRPHLAVQVKSTQATVDVDAVRSFESSAKRHGADASLFVSWSGFTRAALKEFKTTYFTLKFWTADDLLDAIFSCYESLDADVQAELPLKRIWTVVLDE